jgi:hypothetical protein
VNKPKSVKKKTAVRSTRIFVYQELGFVDEATTQIGYLFVQRKDGILDIDVVVVTRQ